MAAVTPDINQARAMRVAVKRIEGFAKQFGEVHRNLARHAAFPFVLTPDLLYQIWANFVPEAPWAAVAHVLLSRLCRQVGYEMYEMEIADRNLLLRELKEQFGQERLDELAEFLLDYIAQQLTEDDADIQDLREAQKWTALAYTKPTEVARELAEALNARVKQENIAEVLRLVSLVETFTEPLLEAGFEPLLAYTDGIASFVRDHREDGATQLRKLAVEESQVEIAKISLDIPLEEQTLPKASTLELIKRFNRGFPPFYEYSISTEIQLRNLRLAYRLYKTRRAVIEFKSEDSKSALYFAYRNLPFIYSDIFGIVAAYGLTIHSLGLYGQILPPMLVFIKLVVSRNQKALTNRTTENICRGIREAVAGRFDVKEMLAVEFNLDSGLKQVETEFYTDPVFHLPALLIEADNQADLFYKVMYAMKQESLLLVNANLLVWRGRTRLILYIMGPNESLIPEYLGQRIAKNVRQRLLGS
jgi:hypothetical protein